jgi:dTDP-4-amino-4,6-dideoxygalactose transaminase
LNCNLNDLSATVGTQQLKKLPAIIRGRRAVGETLKDRLGTDGPVSIGWQVPQTEAVYWFLRVKLNLEALSVDKATFCNALKAEGIPNAPSYRHIPAEAPWFESKSVFGKSGFPWNASDYKGERNPSFKLDNAVEVTNEHFNVAMHESYGDAEIDAIYQALTKVAAAYAK